MSTKISELTAATESIASVDELPYVDKSDTTDAATGTTKKLTMQQLLGVVATESLGSSRDGLATDRGKRLYTSGAGAVNYTVQNGVHTAKDKVDLVMGGTGLLTVVAGTNVTINVKSGKGLKLDGQHSHATLICESTGATDVFTLIGEITA